MAEVTIATPEAEISRRHLSSVNVLGVRIQVMTDQQVFSTVLPWMRDERPHSVYIVNAATANLAYEQRLYRDCLNRGHLVLNDGTGVRWAARWQGVQLAHNHVGTDLIPAICATCRDWPLRVFLFGGRPGVPELAAATLSRTFPDILISGYHHGYTHADEDRAVCDRINAARPHLLLVALGNPLQELWIDRNLNRLNTGVAVGVGGLIDHLAGDLNRAPLWVRQLGFEWLQILLQQPHKWRRYLLGNPRFLYRLATDVHGQRRRAAGA